MYAFSLLCPPHLENIVNTQLNGRGRMVAVVLVPHVLLGGAGGAIVMAHLSLCSPVAGNEILQADTTYEAAIPALVALVVKVHLLVEQSDPVSETVPVRTLAMAVKPVGAIDTQVAETTQTLSAKAERSHHGQLR